MLITGNTSRIHTVWLKIEMSFFLNPRPCFSPLLSLPKKCYLQHFFQIIAVSVASRDAKVFWWNFLLESASIGLLILAVVSPVGLRKCLKLKSLIYVSVRSRYLIWQELMFLCVPCLFNSDILTEMRGSDNIFVAVVLPEVFLKDSKCEMSLHHSYICLHHRKFKNCLEE